MVLINIFSFLFLIVVYILDNYFTLLNTSCLNHLLNVLKQLSILLLISSLLTYFTYFISLYISNGLTKYGFKYTHKKIKLKYDIDKALVMANIGFPIINKYNSSNIYLKSPKLDIKLTADGYVDYIEIENSIKYQEKLEKIDLSSVLPDENVENMYLSKNRKYFIYECEPIELDNQLVFETFNSLYNYVHRHLDDTIPIDSRLYVPLSHIIISGRSGSGKTTALYYLLLFIELRYGKDTLYVIDPKNEGLSVFSDLREYKNEHNPKEVLDIMRDFIGEMKQRQENLKKMINKTGKFDADAIQMGYKPYFIFIDEFAALVSMFDKNQTAEFYSYLRQITMMGRSLGFYIVISLQQANAKDIPTAIREQIQFLIVLGKSGEQTYKTIFDNDILEGSKSILNQKFKIGEGVYYNSLDKQQLKLKKLRMPHLVFLNKYK